MRNIRIELAALANLSCAINGFRESMLRENKLQNGFHTAKTDSGHVSKLRHRREAPVSTPAITAASLTDGSEQFSTRFLV